MAKHGESTLPELPRQHGEAWVWAKKSLVNEIQQGYALEYATRSRMPDVVSVIPAPAREPERPQPSVADRIRTSVEFVPPSIDVAQPHASDSQVSAEALAATVDPRAAQEAAAHQRVMEAIDSFRAEAGLPGGAAVDPGTIPVFPPEPELTSLERAEQDFPSDQYSYGDRSLGDIRGELNDVYSGSGDE